MSDQSKLFVVSAPSGAGKTSLVQALVAGTPSVGVVISFTTRAQRAGEVDGVNYHFTTRESFLDAVADGQFVEYAEVFGNLYGTPYSGIDAVLAAGKHAVLEIDWQGASQIRTRYPDCGTIFILPPSRAALRARLENRGQDDPDTILRRTSDARSEMSHYGEFEFVVVNDNFEVALGSLQAIVEARGGEYRLHAQQAALEPLIHELLAGAPGHA